MIAFILTLGKYDSTLSVQPDSAVFAIRFSLAGVCFICTAIGFIGLLFYPITRKKMEEIANTLKERRNGAIK